MSAENTTSSESDGIGDDDLSELPGVGPSTKESLIDAGYDTFMSIAAADPGALSGEVEGLGEDTATKAVRAAQDQTDGIGFETATAKHEKQQNRDSLNIVIPDDWDTRDEPNKVDKLIGSGVEMKYLTEINGKFGAGKSQITHQLCVNVQLSKEAGGVRGRAVFIDTEDTFRSDRIREMVRGLPDGVLQQEMDFRGIDGTPDDDDAMEALEEDFTNKIHVAKAYNSNHQVALVENAKDIADEYVGTDFPVRLLVVDSLMAHFRAEYLGRGKLAQRQQKLSKHLNDIDKFTDLYDAAGVGTNQMQSNPDQFFGDPNQPIGGNIMSHKMDFRIEIKKSKGETRIFKLFNSPHRANGEADFEVMTDGIKI